MDEAPEAVLAVTEAARLAGAAAGRFVLVAMFLAALALGRPQGKGRLG